MRGGSQGISCASDSFTISIHIVSLWFVRVWLKLKLHIQSLWIDGTAFLSVTKTFLAWSRVDGFYFHIFFYRFSNSFDASLPPLMRDHFLQESWFALCLSFCRGEAYRTNEGIQTCSNETFKARNFNKEQRNKKMMCSKGIVEENGRIKNSLDHWGVRPSPKNDFCFPELLVRTFRITVTMSKSRLFFFTNMATHNCGPEQSSERLPLKVWGDSAILLSQTLRFGETEKLELG